MEYALEEKRPSSASAVQEVVVDYEETQIDVPQLLETIENGLKYLYACLILQLFLIYNLLQIKCHDGLMITQN